MAKAGPITLAIEASNPGPSEQGETPAPMPGVGRASVCLGRTPGASAVEMIGVEPVKSDGRHDDDLMPAIDRLVRRTGLTPRDITRVAISIGPGGFTGLRVAVAAAKMICEATGSLCVAVPTARALIRRVDPALRAGRETIILLAWKRDDVWAERYGAGDTLEPSARGALTRMNGLGLRESHMVVCDGALERILREKDCLPEGAVVARPRFDAAAVLEASALIPPIDPLALAPLYPREPEAVTKWRELKKKG